MTLHQAWKKLMNIWKINIISPDVTFKDEKTELETLG